MTYIMKDNKKIASNNASDITYNNANTSLESDNIQKAIDELISILGGYKFYTNPTVIYSITDDTPYIGDDGSYVLADSDTGITLLEDTTSYYSASVITLVSDSSIYYDESGKYVLADSDTGITLLEDTATYSSATIIISVGGQEEEYVGDNGYYVLADSDTGLELLADSESYTSNTIEGNFYRIAGADSVIPFRRGYESTPATATSDMITEGFTAWVNGELVVGTRPAPPNTLSGSGSTWKDWDQMTMSGSVTFSTPFDTVPTVTARVSYAHDGGYGVTGYFSMSVSNVSRTGFDWKITSSLWVKPASITFTWTAKTA